MVAAGVLLVGWIGMRGILTLAAAAAIPQTTLSGEPFPGRDAIQAIALIATLGTLLIQGTTIGWLVRRLKFDRTTELAEEAEMRSRGREIVTSAPVTSDDPEASFEAQRLAVAEAVHERRLPEETARELIEDIDLRQAARHTGG
ncbi:MAG: hypothetical protein ABW022_25285 [Actinoplanes sp.]